MRFEESESKQKSEAAHVAPEHGPKNSEPEADAAARSDSDRLRDLGLFLPRMVKLVSRLVADPEIPTMDKVLLGAAVFYVIGPIDLIPDTIPILGQLDDLYLLAICLLRLLNQGGPEKIRQYWNGPEDIVSLIQEVTNLSTRFLPEQVRGTIHKWVRARTG
jgi:uncharacterized membrane protein YkvA (DUF1232 family)